VYNRAALADLLTREVIQAGCHRRPLALLMLDIDHFKGVNDRLGHVAGDYTLRTLAGLVLQLIRAEDVLGRYGGEEFVVVLPETGVEQGHICAERLRAAVAAHPFEYEGTAFRATMSVGVAGLRPGECLTPSLLLRQADERLYEAKTRGRNRVCSGPPAEPPAENRAADLSPAG
jgi:diguanylate cyclase (GGDEF)-like protein